jgi:hypothetical protein
LRTEPQRVRVADGVAFRELGEESVLLQLGTGRYFGLDPVATRMWSVLAEAGTVEGAMAVLAEEYEVGRDRLRRDLAELVEELAQRRLVRLEP